ncbi:two-component system response regulator [Desulfobotulus sp.]|uniref:response regulator n=1 Tax=Desulfobotulus sp. TaxID=1940337 RepID=UPI002A35D84B|nr:two-component system response regulator [Desulfobotulus sp.]MDY0162340.1 two-component system response regulator [Desulfobotulus sp.]
MVREPQDCTLMVVDDTETNIDLLLDTLGTEYEIMVAIDGPTALEHAKANPPDLILLDIMMPGMDGFEVCRRLKQDSRTRNIPIIFVTAMNEALDEHKGLALGAVDYITKPFSPPIVRMRVRNHLALKLAQEALAVQNATLEDRVRERTQELERTQDVTIQCMASLAETRDMETGEHIRRSQHYVRTLARHLRHHPRFRAVLDNSHYIEMLFKSAPLHDIGKVGVPDRILLKEGPLTKEEFEEMKRHTLYGHEALRRAEMGLLGQSSFLSVAAEIAYTHHERWDGSGYPRGLKGDEIPVSGRLMAIADVYDALISRRSYKEAFSHEKAVNIIISGDNRTLPAHFDPDVLLAFSREAETFRNIALRFQDGLHIPA